jgi:glucokinase
MGDKIIGVDIGGTSIKMALFDKKNHLIDKWFIPTVVKNNGSSIPQDIIQSIRSKLKEHGSSAEELRGIGIGVPGPVDETVVKRAVNLGWTNLPLKKLMEDELKTVVTVLNDANAAALGELWKGSAEQYNNIVFVTIGTGVGGGIIIDGKILNGKNASAGEIGHIPLQTSEERFCGCGNKNCLECYGSATGMIKTMNQLSGVERVDNTKEIFALAEKNDVAARQTIKETVDYLAQALSGILNTLDPEELVIGGGVSEAGQALLVPLEEALTQYLFPEIRTHLEIRKALLGNDAGIYGTAYHVLQITGSDAK